MQHSRMDKVRSAFVGLSALVILAAIGLFGGDPSARNARANRALPEDDALIFVNGLESGWQDWSWGERKISDPTVKFGGQPSLQFTPNEWRGLLLHHDAFSTQGYDALTFFVQGSGIGGQRVMVGAVGADGKFGPKALISENLVGGKIPAGGFRVCIIPLAKIKADNRRITGIVFQDAAGQPQAPIYLAGIRLRAPNAKLPPGPITLRIDATRELGPISPLIYGMAQPGATHIRDLRLKLTRWGGNPSTRYNWERGNCWNAARDWEFRNGDYNNKATDDRKPSGVADKVIAGSKNLGADTLLTIPTLGWVARNDDTNTRSEGVPNASGPPVAPNSPAIAGYDPTENQRRVSQRSLPRKGRPFADPPDLTDDAVYQDEWVYHLTRKFGPAKSGGVRYYAMDNEPDLWHGTHTDMHPVRPDYDELLRQFLAYGTAVKDVDPSSQITGPVSWGWTGYFFSPRDQGDDNYASHADRSRHGGVAFLPWFLSQVAAHDRKTGRRTLDVLDVHYYPQGQGVYGGQTDPATNALRLRSVRALYDPTYSDESWIATSVQLLPRLRQWVRQNYPGTKIGLTEWNFGADTTLNGGLAVADTLGVLGRERVDIACYWTAPPLGSPGYLAYKLFRNADDKGHGFGDVALATSLSDPDPVSAYASRESQTGATAVIIINKMPSRAATVTLDLRAGRPVARWEAYRVDGAHLKSIARLPDIAMNGTQARLILPAYSMTLLRGR